MDNNGRSLNLARSEMDCTAAKARNHKRRRLNERTPPNVHPLQHTTIQHSISVPGFIDQPEYTSGFPAHYEEHILNKCVEADEFGNAAEAEANLLEDPGHPASLDGDCCYGMVSRTYPFGVPMLTTLE